MNASAAASPRRWATLKLKLRMRLLTLFFSLITLNSFGQDLSKNVQITADSDTAFRANYYSPIIEKLKLINPSSDTDFFRISSSKYFLELSQKSNRIVFYVHEIWESNQTGETYIKSFDIHAEQVKKIKLLIDSLEINKIPSDKYISSWTHGFDGITYIFENKKDNHYSFKNYWTPSSQKNLKEAQNILTFTNQLDGIIEYSAKRKLFEREIPFYGWTYNGSMAVTRVISNTKEYRKYKRMKKRQLRNQE